MNLIIGQGLAGTVLAFTLRERGEEVRIVDDGHRSSSSMVAAGLWNPIVFRRIHTSWIADSFINTLEEFYPKVEKLTGAEFYTSLPVWRVHGNQQEADYWQAKKDLPEFAPYLAEANFSSAYKFPEFEFGDGFVRHCGFIKVPEFLMAARAYFISKGIYREENLELPDDPQEACNILCAGKKPDRVIDCRGYQSARSPWFSYLGFGLTKGELLTIRCPGLSLESIFNAGFFLLPLGDDLYRLGATFDWDRVDDVPTEEGKQELLNKFKAWIDLPVEVIDHQAGIRPTVEDRRPLIGKHLTADQLYIFNGLGTKGVMLAPFLAAHFVDFLLEGKPLHPEADIKRYTKFFGKR